MKKILIATSLLFFSSAAQCQYDRYWFEYSAGFYFGDTFKVKIREEHKGWALIYSRYDEGGAFGTTNLSRETFEPINANFNVYGISRFASAPFNWGYADVGIGVGYGDGTWSVNCEYYKGGFFGDSDICDMKDTSTFGIPLHASAAIGKYAGVGVNFDMFISLELDTFFQLGLVVPIGLFTK